MNKAELIEAIKTERAALEAVLATLTPPQMHVAGVCGEWSVKDILAHLASWAARGITLAFEAERGAKPSYPTGAGDPNWVKLNAADHATQKDRPLDRVLADFRGTHTQLLKRIDALSPELLFDARHWQLRGRPLAHVLSGDSYEHDAEHRAQIESWRATLLARG
jgi:uncharacterized protein (TIGR03083 family)